MNETLTLKSGASLELQMAPFAVSMKLFKTIAAELKQVDINLDGLSLEAIKGTNLNGIKNAVFQLLGSDQLELALGACMERCLYNGVKITKGTFESPEARQDYLPVAWEVMKFNLAPFFSSLGLSYSTNEPATGSGPK